MCKNKKQMHTYYDFKNTFGKTSRLIGPKIVLEKINILRHVDNDKLPAELRLLLEVRLLIIFWTVTRIRV